MKDDKHPSSSNISAGGWLPIKLADKSITNVQYFHEIGLKLSTSDRYWVRDGDDRVFEASWSVSDHGRQSYWWDWESESPVDPVEFMPHPLDRRYFAPRASDGQND